MQTSLTVYTPIRSLTLAMVVLSQACLVDGSPATLPKDTDPEQAELVPEYLGENRQMLALAREIPGFGGVFYGGSNRVVIAMAANNAAGFAAARKAVSARLTGTGNAPLELVKQVVEFSFIDLARQRARLRARLFGIPGVETLSVHQASNRIRIGLSSPSARAAVLDLANELEVPIEMIALSKVGHVRYALGSVEDPVTRMAMDPPTLQDIVSMPDSSLRGGYQVSTRVGLPCTAGFAAYTIVPDTLGSHPLEYYGFVSASHCSGEVFRQDTFAWGQPTVANLIGREVIDPPDNDPRRRADATFVQAHSGPMIRLGQLARPSFRAVLGPREPGPRIITVDSILATMQITATRAMLFPGEKVDKIGRTTGWTSGEVIDECVDTKLLGHCVESAWLDADGGDSGGPIFYYDSIGYRGQGSAELAGILVGLEFDIHGKHTGKTYFSNMENIELDLGILQAEFCRPLICPPGNVW